MSFKSDSSNNLSSLKILKTFCDSLLHPKSQILNPVKIPRHENRDLFHWSTCLLAVPTRPDASATFRCNWKGCRSWRHTEWNKAIASFLKQLKSEMVNISVFTRFYTSQVVVWDFFHQQYQENYIPAFFNQQTSLQHTEEKKITQTGNKTTTQNHKFLGKNMCLESAINLKYVQPNTCV